MLPFLFFLILLLNVYLFLQKKENKIIQIVTVIFVLFFVAGIRYNGSVIGYDLRNYAIHYSDPSTISALEFGFKAVNHLGRLFGLSFEQFYMVLTTLCICSIFNTVRKLGCNMHFFAIAYLLGFMLIPSSQLRNACAFSIFFSLFPFYQENGKFNYKKVCFGILLAATFHTTFILFLLYPATVRLKKKYIFWGFVGIIFVGLLLIVTGGMKLISGLLAQIVIMLGPAFSKYTKYFAEPTRLSPLCSISILFVMIFALDYWKRIFMSRRDKVNSVILRRNANEMLRICMVSACFIPLLLLNATNYRFFRDISIIVIAHLGINTNTPSRGKKERLILLGAAVAICVGWFLFDIVIKGYWTSFIQNIFVRQS